MQNKPNFRNDKMNVTRYSTKDYENKARLRTGQNKANSNPIKPNLLDAQMNVSSILTNHYENIYLRGREENKPNQTQFQGFPEEMRLFVLLWSPPKDPLRGYGQQVRFHSLEPFGQLLAGYFSPQAFFAASGSGFELFVFIIETVPEAQIRIGIAFCQQGFV